MATLMIGEVVRLTGKAASTIRYYEEIGLILPPECVSGRRRDCALFEESLLPDPADAPPGRGAGRP